MWDDIIETIQRHNNFLITTHVNPDGDGIGATCALTELLLQLGKKVRFVCDSPIPNKFAFLDYHQTHEEYSPQIAYDDVDVVIVLDTHKKERIGYLGNLVDQGLTSICIDHHEVSESFTSHLAIDPKACAVGAMIYSLYKECGFELNCRAATGIYASIVCDTGRFSYPSTTQEAHQIAAACIQQGVDPDLMHNRLFRSISLPEIKMFAYTLLGLETYFDNRVVIQEIRQSDWEKLSPKLSNIENMDLEYIHEFNNQIEEVQCFVLLRELNANQVRVSLRSRTNIDISPVVQALGGGGHPRAGGISWQGSLEEVKTKILNLLQNLTSPSLVV